MPNIETLVDDIYSLFDPEKHHEPNEKNIEDFLSNLGDLLKTRLSKRDETSSALRFSNLGKPDRQFWYMVNDYKREPMGPKTYLKFFYGDVIEQVLLFLAKEAGHDVSHEQAEVVCDGVKGHLDAVIDGVTVDVKSASPFGFKKFKDGSIFESDSFGYLDQLGGYANIVTPEAGGAFLAMNKVDGEICLLKIGPSILNDFKPEPQVKRLKEISELATAPMRCFNPIPDGKSGNMKLDTECSYCGFKEDCWPKLRTFIYSNGPRFLTSVERVPDVYEVPK